MTILTIPSIIFAISATDSAPCIWVPKNIQITAKSCVEYMAIRFAICLPDSLDFSFWVVLSVIIIDSLSILRANINPLRANFFQMKHKHVFPCYVLPHWPVRGSWNPSSCKTRTDLFFIVNIMGADVLTSPRSQGINNRDIYYVEPD